MAISEACELPTREHATLRDFFNGRHMTIESAEAEYENINCM